MTSLAQIAESIPDGATVALGGAGLQRKPMAAARALAEAGRRDLRVVSYLGSLDVELLLAAGCVGELHSAGVALDGAGLAPRFRAARQAGEPAFVEWSEGLLLRALEATAAGVPSMPAWMGLGTDLPELNPYLRAVRDPFTGEEVMQVRALAVDVAILHVPLVDDRGHAHVSGDLAADGLLARAARRTIVTYEQAGWAPPAEAALGRIWIDEAVPALRGAWPCGCHPAYRPDLKAISAWAKAGAEADVGLLAPAGEGAR